MNAIPPSALNDIRLHERIVAIDPRNREKDYPIDKLEAHVRNVPHVAISVFVFSGDQLLLQKRADTKYHSAGLWANTVCSHPRWQESAIDCAGRRLHEELGWSTALREFGQIDYAAKVGDLFENEHVHCFAGEFDEFNDLADFNIDEVAAVQWLSLPAILAQMSERPEIFTEWFKIYMNNYRHMIVDAFGSRTENSESSFLS